MVTLIFLYRTSMQLEAFHTNFPSLPWTVSWGICGTWHQILWYSACLTQKPVMWRRERWPGQLFALPRPATIQLGKPHMPVLMPANPSLASFVGTDSWKLWELLGVGHAWLWQPVHWWSRSNDYNVAEQFVWGLTVVNDGAERCVCTITDFAQATSDSIYQEDILLIGNSHWEVFQDLQKAALARLNP